MFETIADVVVYSWLKLTPGTPLADSLNFFIYDLLKISLMIFLVITFIAFLRSYLSPAKIKQWLSQKSFGLGYLAAAVFGAVSPFCSCSSVPLFIGFVESGIPIGVAFAFLITSPLVNEVLFVLMLGTFGLKTALLYAGFGILLGVVGGAIIQRLGLEKELIGFDSRPLNLVLPKTIKDKIKYALTEGSETFNWIFPYLLAGVAIGAAIHGYVPTEWITGHINSRSILAIPVAVILGVPMYAGCSTLVPIVFAFTQKGIAIGTAMAFMMAVAGLSFPEAILLKRVMRLRLLAIFFGVVAIGIVAVGYLFNLLY
ncbi:MAG: permease [Candidatus Margulisbacteria bacterium]|nr:permease [Candidatus Margulisiibacteriota bacterium]MBU1617273.1 permease [Candidatus Margulisiibacteriota bacterium]